MKLRTLVLALAVAAATVAAAAPSPSDAAATGTWHLVDSTGPLGAFGDARGLGAGAREVVLGGGTASPALLAWLGSAERRTVTLLLVSGDGTPVARYKFHDGWPRKWTGVSLDAAKNEVAIESLTLATEG